MATRKIMDIELWGKKYFCIHEPGAVNPYKLYEKWYDRGWHRKKIAEYGNMDSIMFHLMQIKYPYGIRF